MQWRSSAHLTSSGLTVPVDVSLVSTFVEGDGWWWGGSAVGEDESLTLLVGHLPDGVAWLLLPGGLRGEVEVRWSPGTPAMLVGTGPPPFVS